MSRSAKDRPSAWRIGAVAVAILLFVLFLLAPRTPKRSEETIDNAVVNTAVDNEVQKAVELVKNSEQPMEGILKLRSILQKDPKNIDAAWNLGLFSMQTGQFENAISRFSQVIEHDEKGVYPESHFYLGKALEETGDVEQAKTSYKRFVESSSDEEVIEHVKALISEL